MVVLLCLGASPRVFADSLDPDTLDAINQDTVWHAFDTGGGNCTANSNAAIASTPVNLNGNDNIEKTFRFFVGKGLDPKLAAGITGNSIAESNVNPKSVSKSGGFSGMFQWDTRGRFANLKKWDASKGYDPLSLEGQLEFAWYEANARGNIAGLQQQTSVDLAAWYWGRFFEVAIIGGSQSKVPLTNVQALTKRINGAEATFNKYGPGISAPTATSTTTVTPADQASSCSLTGNGQNTTFIDGFTVYSQYDPAWAGFAYGQSTIAESGCGPSAMAMIITNLTKKSITPADTALYATSRGLYKAGVGSSWDIAPVLADHWGLRTEAVGKDIAKITTALRAGGLVIASGKGALPFTSGGHYIVIRGITADGKFKIGDSGHTATNNQTWDPQKLIDETPGGSTYAIYQ